MAAALARVVALRFRVVGNVAAHGFKQHVDVAGRPQGREEFSGVELMRTKVVEHGATVVE